MSTDDNNTLAKIIDKFHKIAQFENILINYMDKLEEKCKLLDIENSKLKKLINQQTEDNERTKKYVEQKILDVLSDHCAQEVCKNIIQKLKYKFALDED